MGQTRILIVEDELLTAEAMKVTLAQMGYLVVGICSNGSDAIRVAAVKKPALILMDIRFGRNTDGIQVAQAIQAFFDVPIPIVYVTAYADEETLSRARPTLPAGYVLKPFVPDQLRATIEVALARHRVELERAEQKAWLRGVINATEQAVLAVDGEGVVTLMNPAAEVLTGWTQAESLGKQVGEVLVLLEEPARTSIIVSPVHRAMQEGTAVQLGQHGAILVARDGTEHAIADSAAPIRNQNGAISGAVMVFRTTAVAM